MTNQTRETAGVLAGLVGSMLLAVLLLFSMTGGGFFLALFVLALLPVGLGVLALESAMNYQPVQGEMTVMAAETAAPVVRPVAATAASRSWQPALIGALSALALLGVYFNAMTAWEGLPHTVGHLRGDWASIIAVTASFGLLVCAATQASTEGSISGRVLTFGVAGSGLGMLGLFACCTPLLVHYFPAQIVLPAAIMAIQYSILIVALGIVINMVASLAIAIRQTSLATASS